MEETEGREGERGERKEKGRKGGKVEEQREKGGGSWSREVRRCGECVIAAQ